MSLDPDMHFGRPSSTAVRRLDLPRLVSTHHQYPRTPSPLPAPLQHNCASHYPANELTAHENIFRIYHRTLQPPATAQSRFTLQLPSLHQQFRYGTTNSSKEKKLWPRGSSGSSTAVRQTGTGQDQRSQSAISDNNLIQAGSEPG